MADPTSMVFLGSPLNTLTGYGRDAVGLVTGALDLGWDVYLENLSNVNPPLEQRVCDLVGKHPPLECDMVLRLGPPHQIEPMCSGSDFKAFVYWTMWEWTTLNLDSDIQHKLAEVLEHVTHLVAYDAQSLSALRGFCATHGIFHPRPVQHMGGIEADMWRPLPAAPVQRHWERGKPFRFLMSGRLSGRKLPYLAAQAFTDLKNDPDVEFDDAELHIKTLSEVEVDPCLSSDDLRLRVHLGDWSQPKLRSFYAAGNVLVAPSRGEGKNNPAMEMMTGGGTVIATDWGGHAEWLDDSYAYPLDYELVPHLDDALWAAPDFEHLKKLMLQAYNDRGEARAKAEKAMRVIPERFDWPAVMAGLAQKVLGDG